MMGGRAVLFPGQGVQRRGMGAAVFDAYPDLLAGAESIAGFSIRDFFRDDSLECFGDTRYVQPALYVVNALSYRKYVDEGRLRPAFLAGHSLGEVNALQAAGVFDFETGLRMVQERARYMSECTGGGMAAVLGLTADEVAGVLAQDGFRDLAIANYNSDLQVVISGPTESIRRAEDVFYERFAVKYFVLRASGAFHTSLLRSAAAKFGGYLETLTFSAPSIPVISNVTAAPYTPGAVARLLAEQIVRPVLWSRSVSYMRAHGVSEFTEAGEGATLLDMVKNIASE